LPWRDREVLELAPGTGLWSEWLLRHGAQLSVVDGSPAMVDQLRQRLGSRLTDERVTIADLFSWQPPSTFDGVFFGFFVSHVPRNQLRAFFDRVASALRPGGIVGFVDSLREPTSTAHNHVLPDDGDEIMVRRLDDGREYDIVKNFYEAAELTLVAAEAGLSLAPTATARYFLYGSGVRL
jgi:SAM-dependent methyltransferase